MVEHFLKVNHLQGIPPIRNNVFRPQSKSPERSLIWAARFRCAHRIRLDRGAAASSSRAAMAAIFCSWSRRQAWPRGLERPSHPVKGFQPFPL